MKTYILRREQVIARPIGEVFSFFEQPENLAKITPPSMRFAILTPGSVKMRSGALIDYTVHVLGLPRHWRTLITEYDPPHRFVDVQLKGPYTFWHHTHTFEETGQGTRIIDDVRYIVPFGIFGKAVHALVIRRQLKRIFDYRAKIIGETFA